MTAKDDSAPQPQPAMDYRGGGGDDGGKATATAMLEPKPDGPQLLIREQKRSKWPLLLLLALGAVAAYWLAT